MSAATKPRFTIVFLMILLTLSLGFPAEDIPETTYDESETLPYEDIPLFSIVLPLAAARTIQAPLRSLHPKPGAYLCLPLHVSATPMPTDPPMHEPYRPYSAFCFVSCVDCLA